MTFWNETTSCYAYFLIIQTIKYALLRQYDVLNRRKKILAKKTQIFTWFSLRSFSLAFTKWKMMVFNLAIRFYDNALSTLAQAEEKKEKNKNKEKEKISV